MTEFGKAIFSIDSIFDKYFEGYTNGDSWNGFACPFFEKNMAEQVLKASEGNGYSWTYNSERDVFIVQSSQDPLDYAPEEFEGQTIIVDGREVRVYGIGAYSWIWGETSS